MKNKIELKKTIICSIIITIIFSGFFVIFETIKYRTYTVKFNEKIAGIITKVKNEYPEITTNDLMEIMNSKQDVNSEIFKTYSVDLEQNSIILENEQSFIKFSILTFMLSIVLAISIIFVFLKYNKNKDKTLKMITQYIEEINNRNYKLDIESNTEDELSILKNEIYKTTIMLKEVAENSMKDKVNLKDSLSDISHQLKTPITSIMIMLDNIIDEPSMNADIRTEFIKDIKREILNINFLVNSLLKLSKLDSNTVKFNSKEEYVEDLIDESVKNVSVICDLKNVEIRKNGDRKIKLNCDRKWQVEAITNILKNAIEHSNENSVIDISYSQNKVYSKIEIKDYGNGIDKKELPHIFERFYRGENSKSDSVGIGLALSKSIIEKDGGNVEAVSEIGSGTKFVIKYSLI
ncbi:MAG: HAMP domain-containing histidine kinase [Clostridia bacterium]|nr:HAMP domain-containing histidine kinase [Clostridia bacterium]